MARFGVCGQWGITGFLGKSYGQSAGLVSSVLNRMERNRQSPKSLRAVISMEITTLSFVMPIRYNEPLRICRRVAGKQLSASSGTAHSTKFRLIMESTFFVVRV